MQSVQNQKLAIVANPKSGHGQAVEALRAAKRYLWKQQYDVFLSKSAEDLENFGRTLSAQDYAAIVVLGGDGSLHYVTRGLLNNPSPPPLYAYPTGTANDFASEMKTTPNWSHVEELVLKGKHEKIDLIMVNEHPALTVAGVGVGSDVLKDFSKNRYKSKILKVLHKKLKDQTYSVLAVKNILSRKRLNRKINVLCGSFNQSLDTPSVIVSNQTHLGGKIRVSPHSAKQSAQANVMILPEANRFSLLRNLFSLTQDKIPEDVLSFITNDVTLKSIEHEDLDVFADGELVGTTKEVRFLVLPKSISVFKDEARI